MPVIAKKVIFIVGPTAIGKTALALKMARRIKAEIVSCDSMQVYKGMDILSQAPSVLETKKVSYHLIKFLEPNKEYSVALFRKNAEPLIKDIIKRKKTPIVVGGSGLYVKGLIDGLFPSPKADLKFRKKMYDYVRRHGSAKLHKKLVASDPASAKSIHPNDARRIIRSLEILNSTGKTMTELKGETKGIVGIYNIKIFGLTASRDRIYSNINDRVDKMFDSGVVGEVRRLSKKTLSRTARAALGFKEITGYLKGDYDIETARELMKRNTRRFAKRQLTWFKGDKRIKWIKKEKINWNELLRSR